MKNGFTSGIVLGGIVGATMSMIINKDINVNKTRKRMMRIGKNVYKKFMRMISDIGDMF